MSDIFSKIDDVEEPLLNDDSDQEPAELFNESDTINLEESQDRSALLAKASEMRKQASVDLKSSGIPLIVAPTNLGASSLTAASLKEQKFESLGDATQPPSPDLNSDPAESQQNDASPSEPTSNESESDQDDDETEKEDGEESKDEDDIFSKAEQAEKERLEQEARDQANANQGNEPQGLPGEIAQGVSALVGGTLKLASATTRAGTAAIDGASKVVGTTLELADDALSAMSKLITDLYDKMSYGAIAFKNQAIAKVFERGEPKKEDWQPANEAIFDPEDKLNASQESSPGDPVTPTALTNATKDVGLGNISEKIKAFQETRTANIEATNTNTKDAFTGSIKDSLKTVESTLKLNEVGQIPLQSRSDFESRVKSSSPADQERIKSALQNIVTSGEQYQKDTRKFIQGDGGSASVDSLPTDTAAKEVNSLDQKAADPTADLDDHEKKLFSMLSMDGETMGEKLGNMMSGLRDMMSGIASRLNVLGASQEKAAANGPTEAQSQRLG